MMTKQEAMVALQEGKRITHVYFSDDEYLTMENGYFADENDYRLSWGEFWELRASEAFYSGWEIYK